MDNLIEIYKHRTYGCIIAIAIARLYISQYDRYYPGSVNKVVITHRLGIV